MTPLLIEGFCDPRFAKARDLFAENWDLFEETGASVAATLDGKPIRLADLRRGKAVSRRYRNRRIGEFLKELDLTEGRATGIPKILRAMRANSSALSTMPSGVSP